MFGLKVVVSEAALQDGDVRLFAASKNRSRRIHKKLVKRFGGEFKKVPAIYQMGDTLIAHPTVFHLLKQEIANSRREPGENPIPVGPSGLYGGGLEPVQHWSRERPWIEHRPLLGTARDMVV